VYGPTGKEKTQVKRRLPDMTTKQIKEILLGKGIDRVIAKKDGSFEARRGYFYRHGQTAAGLAELVKSAIPNAQILESNDRWNTWPHDSYFQVIFRISAEKIIRDGIELYWSEPHGQYVTIPQG
jgi:hypothetical protein